VGDYSLIPRPYFSMDSLVNSLFCFCSTCWNAGKPIRLCCITDVIHGNNCDQVIKAVCRRLGYTGLKPDHKKAVKSFVNGPDVFNSLTTSSGKFECQ